MKHNTGVSNIEITDQNIRAFSATAKKYGIDFALKKDTSGEIPRYLVFFKGRDADVITAAFREFSAKNLEKEKKPSIRTRDFQLKHLIENQYFPLSCPFNGWKADYGNRGGKNIFANTKIRLSAFADRRIGGIAS